MPVTKALNYDTGSHVIIMLGKARGFSRLITMGLNGTRSSRDFCPFFW